MPKGKGTYGDQVGRPPKKDAVKNEKYAMGGMIGNNTPKPKPTTPISGGTMADPRPDAPWQPAPNTFNDGGQLPTYDARNRNESVEGFMEGGGTPQAVNQYAEGGQVGGEQPDSYFLGGMLKKAKKRLKKAFTRPSQWREWKPFKQRGLGLGKLAAGAAQAITNTSDPMYDKLADFDGQSLSALGDYYTSESQEPEAPTPGHLKDGFGFAKGGKVNKRGKGGFGPGIGQMTEGKDYDSEKAKGGKVGKTPGKAGEMFDQFAFNIYEEHEQAEGGVIESKVTHGLKSGKGLKKGYGRNPGFKNKGLKKGKGLTNTRGGIKSTKGKPKKFRKPEAGENKFTGKYNEKAIRRGMTYEEAKEKGKKNVFRRKK